MGTSAGKVVQINDRSLQLGEQLGAGGYANVNKVTDPATGDVFALKQMQVPRSDAERRSIAEWEFHLAQTLPKHAHLVDFVDVARRKFAASSVAAGVQDARKAKAKGRRQADGDDVWAHERSASASHADAMSDGSAQGVGMLALRSDNEEEEEEEVGQGEDVRGLRGERLRDDGDVRGRARLEERREQLHLDPRSFLGEGEARSHSPQSAPPARLPSPEVQESIAIDPLVLLGIAPADQEAMARAAAAAAARERFPHVHEDESLQTREYLFLMEFCPNGTLLDLIQEQRLGDFAAKMGAFAQLCAGVAHLHAQNPPIAHRDIKPENVLIAADGSFKLCDLGSSVAGPVPLTNSDERSVEEQRIERTTTVSYRAPEMVDLFAREQLDESVDIWALGCVFYMILFNASPFQATGKLAILSASYDLPDHHPYSPEVIALLRAMLSTNPGDRPTVQEILQRLQGLGCGEVAAPVVVEDQDLSLRFDDDEPELEAEVSAPRAGVSHHGAPSPLEVLDWNDHDFEVVPPELHDEHGQRLVVDAPKSSSRSAPNTPKHKAKEQLRPASAAHSPSPAAKKSRSGGFVELLSYTFSTNSVAKAVYKATREDWDQPKPKHVRKLVVLSWSAKPPGVASLYSQLSKRPVTSSPEVAFKSLQVVHQILVEGHPAVLAEAVANAMLFEQLSLTWSLPERAEVCTPLLADLLPFYPQFMSRRVDFFRQFPAFEGNFSLDLMMARVQMVSSPELAAKMQNRLGELADVRDMEMMQLRSPGTWVDDALRVVPAVFAQLRDTLELGRRAVDDSDHPSEQKASFRQTPLVLVLDDMAALYDTLVFLLHVGMFVTQPSREERRKQLKKQKKKKHKKKQAGGPYQALVDVERQLREFTGEAAAFLAVAETTDIVKEYRRKPKFLSKDAPIVAESEDEEDELVIPVEGMYPSRRPPASNLPNLGVSHGGLPRFYVQWLVRALRPDIAELVEEEVEEVEEEEDEVKEEEEVAVEDFSFDWQDDAFGDDAFAGDSSSDDGGKLVISGGALAPSSAHEVEQDVEEEVVVGDGDDDPFDFSFDVADEAGRETPVNVQGFNHPAEGENGVVSEEEEEEEVEHEGPMLKRPESFSDLVINVEHAAGSVQIRAHQGLSPNTEAALRFGPDLRNRRASLFDFGDDEAMLARRNSHPFSPQASPVEHDSEPVSPMNTYDASEEEPEMEGSSHGVKSEAQQQREEEEEEEFRAGFLVGHDAPSSWRGGDVVEEEEDDEEDDEEAVFGGGDASVFPSQPGMLPPVNENGGIEEEAAAAVMAAASFGLMQRQDSAQPGMAGSLQVSTDSNVSASSGNPFEDTDDEEVVALKDLSEMTAEEREMYGEIELSELELGERVGIGAFAEVFTGTWRDTDVAVKKLLGKHYSPEALHEFRLEMATMRKLRHPNIIMFMAAVTRPPTLCIVTELLCGSLFDLLHNSDVSLSWKKKLRMALDAARGMNFLHLSGIIHRDLKSPNLLLDKNYRVKVCDFGLATSNVKRTMTGNVGTGQWMANEVIAGNTYTEKADVYSFGVILWELATRTVPYADSNRTSVQIGLAVIQGERPPLPAASAVPDGFNELTAQCWDADPDVRPSFHDIVTRLKEAEAHLRKLERSSSATFFPALLALVAPASTPSPLLQQAAALYLKNSVKDLSYHSSPPSSPTPSGGGGGGGGGPGSPAAAAAASSSSSTSSKVRAYLRGALEVLMGGGTSLPRSIGSVLSEAVAHLARRDWPDQAWPGLFPLLETLMASDSAELVERGLRTCVVVVHELAGLRFDGARRRVGKLSASLSKVAYGVLAKAYRSMMQLLHQASDPAVRPQLGVSMELTIKAAELLSEVVPMALTRVQVPNRSSTWRQRVPQLSAEECRDLFNGIASSLVELMNTSQHFASDPMITQRLSQIVHFLCQAVNTTLQDGPGVFAPFAPPFFEFYLTAIFEGAKSPLVRMDMSDNCVVHALEATVLDSMYFFVQALEPSSREALLPTCGKPTTPPGAPPPDMRPTNMSAEGSVGLLSDQQQVQLARTLIFDYLPLRKHQLDLWSESPELFHDCEVRNGTDDHVRPAARELLWFLTNIYPVRLGGMIADCLLSEHMTPLQLSADVGTLSDEHWRVLLVREAIYSTLVVGWKQISPHLRQRQFDVRKWYAECLVKELQSTHPAAKILCRRIMQLSCLIVGDCARSPVLDLLLDGVGSMLAHSDIAVNVSAMDAACDLVRSHDVPPDALTQRLAQYTRGFLSLCMRAQSWDTVVSTLNAVRRVFAAMGSLSHSAVPAFVEMLEPVWASMQTRHVLRQPLLATVESLVGALGPASVELHGFCAHVLAYCLDSEALKTEHAQMQQGAGLQGAPPSSEREVLLQNALHLWACMVKQSPVLTPLLGEMFSRWVDLAYSELGLDHINTLADVALVYLHLDARAIMNVHAAAVGKTLTVWLHHTVRTVTEAERYLQEMQAAEGRGELRATRGGAPLDRFETRRHTDSLMAFGATLDVLTLLVRLFPDQFPDPSTFGAFFPHMVETLFNAHTKKMATQQLEVQQRSKQISNPHRQRVRMSMRASPLTRMAKAYSMLLARMLLHSFPRTMELLHGLPNPKQTINSLVEVLVQDERDRTNKARKLAAMALCNLLVANLSDPAVFSRTQFIAQHLFAQSMPNLEHYDGMPVRELEEVPPEQRDHGYREAELLLRDPVQTISLAEYVDRKLRECADANHVSYEELLARLGVQW